MTTDGNDGNPERGAFDAAREIERLNDRAARDSPLTLDDLVALMRVLRDPVRGCPWDREQDFASIAPYTIEEAYEVADAIARGDMADLRDELGDLLLQTVYHAQMAEEAGEFDFRDVADAVARKMIRRHPHVFGDVDARAAAQVSGLWERIKAQEAQTRMAAQGGKPEPQSILDGVPPALPALTRSVKLQRRAAKAGFDWDSPPPILEKIREELNELEQEIKSGDQVKIQEEMGDLLFAVANLARRLSVDPEDALRSAARKFERRFRHIESRIAEDGRVIAAVNLPEMEELWREAKEIERRTARSGSAAQQAANDPAYPKTG